MQVKRFNISKPKKYTDSQGAEKTQWNQIGTITEFHKDDGSISRIIEIPAIGLEANIFPFKDPNQQGGGYRNQQSLEPSQEQYKDEISVDSIPF